MADMLTEARQRHQTDLPFHSANVDYINRHRLKFPSEELSGGFGYVFFTKPDLNFYDSANNGRITSPEYMLLAKERPDLFNSLHLESGTTLLNLLGNMAESFDTQDEVIKTRDTIETSNDYKIVYGGIANESRAANNFNINYCDDRTLSVYKLHSIWVNYINLVTSGAVRPKRQNIEKKILDYACSVYYFVTSEDGSTILFFSKYIGVFPTNIPSSAFSWSKDGIKRPEFQIQYQYSFKRDNYPPHLAQFNKLNNYDGSAGSIRGNVIGTHLCAKVPSQTFCNQVFVQEDRGKLKLRFAYGR